MRITLYLFRTDVRSVALGVTRSVRVTHSQQHTIHKELIIINFFAKFPVFLD